MSAAELTPFQKIREENRAREKAVNKTRRTRRCRCSSRCLLEDVGSRSFTSPNLVGGTDQHEGREFFLRNAWGWNDTGICTLRCAMRWADKHAPRVSS